MSTRDRSIEGIARRQKGFVTRAQCRSAGMTDKMIHYRVQACGWRRHLPGVFLLPGVQITREGELLAVYLWGGEGSMLCRSSAAYLLQLDDSHPAAPELYLRSGRSAQGVRTYRLAKDDRPASMKIHGMRATRAERTLLDLSAQWPSVRVGRAMDTALRDGRTSLQRLAREPDLCSSRGRAGTALYRSLVRGRDHRDTSVRSDFETRMLRILKAVRSHTVVPNYLVSDGVKDRYLDFAFPELRLGIECQSIRWHMGEEYLKADMARHRRLSLSGWMILFFCWDDVVFEKERVLREVEEAIATRACVLFS